jgi:hypothetical protein
MAKGFEIKFDKGFGKKLEQEVMKEVRKETQAFFDSMSRRYRGRSVEEIKPVLQREWRQKLDGTITEPELTEYATAISEGTRIDVR